MASLVSLRAGAEVRWDEVVQVADLVREGAPQRHVRFGTSADEAFAP